MEKSNFVEICKKIISSRFEIISDNSLKNGTLVAKTTSGLTCILIHSGDCSEEEIAACAKRLKVSSQKNQCNDLLLMYSEKLEEKVFAKLSDNDIEVWDATIIGAHIAVWSQVMKTPTLEKDLSMAGHYRFVNGGEYVDAEIFVNCLLEGGLLEIKGDAYYGINNEFGPNLGTISFVADDCETGIWAERKQDEYEPFYSAAKFGNLVVYETYEYSLDGKEPYRAIFEFNDDGLVCNELNSGDGGFGHNVGFEGHYVKGNFDLKAEAGIPESTVIQLAYEFSGDFRSNRIGSTEIRDWLEQFKTEEQALIVQLLRNFKFYNTLRVRQSMHYLHGKVDAYLKKRYGKNYTKLVSAFGSPAKSGSSYARMYRQENELSGDSVIELTHLPEKLKFTKEVINAVVFVEDVIGTGEDAVSVIKDMEESCGDILLDNQIAVVVVAICGLDYGLARVRSIQSKFPIKVICMDEVTKCFDGEYNLFQSEQDREDTKSVANRIGMKLRPDKPLGYKDSQMLVAFYDNCPNNTLPIIWASPIEGTPTNWRPLFPRV